MFFSIVIPIYNVESYLGECIDSILDQTFTDFELILVDDGSKDRSSNICDKYAEKDNRIKVVHKENGGQALARNIGTNLAQGQYLIYIDSDDYIAENTFLEDIHNKAGNGTDIICYKFKKYYDKTSRMAECGFSIPEFSTTDSMEKRVECLVINDAFYCAPWTKAIKLAIIRDNNVRFKDGLLSEDQDWYYNVLFNANSIEGIDKSYIVYRQRRNSTSNFWKIKNLTDTISIIKSWKTKIESSEVNSDYKIALLNSLAKLYCNLLIGYSRYKNTEKKKYYCELKALSDLMKYHKNPRVNTFYKVYKVGGFEAMIFSIKIICMVRL
jgi:glycosyltransferase involved in cell wall biosynthesis